MTDVAAHHTLAAEDLTLAYDEVEVARDLSISIPTGRVWRISSSSRTTAPDSPPPFSIRATAR